jgi:hypothetical protein
MLNRVNIQYTIELDELPAEVERLYAKAKDIFSELSLPKADGKQILTSDVLKNIEKTRTQLTCLDHILSDVSGIVGSYIEYEVSSLKAQEQLNQPVTPEMEQYAKDALEMS